MQGSERDVDFSLVTIAAVLLLVLIAAVVSYSHMYELALCHGEPEWRASLFPLSVDGMIGASSMTLLSDARDGRKSGVLPWTLLIIGSGAFLTVDVAVAAPTVRWALARSVDVFTRRSRAA